MQDFGLSVEISIKKDAVTPLAIGFNHKFKITAVYCLDDLQFQKCLKHCSGSRVSSCWFPVVGFLISNSKNESLVVSKNLVLASGHDVTFSHSAQSFSMGPNTIFSCHPNVSSI